MNGGTVTLGSGLTRVTGVTRQATTADASNPMSLLTETTTFTVNGRNYVMVYSSATRTVEEITPGSRRLGKTLDGRGRVVEERYRSLAALKYTYDVRGRMSVVRQGPRETLLAYNAGGYLSGVRDAVGRQVTFATDALGRVTRQTMPDGRLVDYGYDANGNVTALTPPGRGEHRFTYGAGDLPGTYVTPLGATTRYDYDEDAQLKTLTRPGGDTVAVTRDGAGRMGSMTTGAGATTYAYDAAGRLGSVTAPGGVGLAYAYEGDLVTGAELTGAVAGRGSDVRRGLPDGGGCL
ncbi:MAG: RHS repeat protein [Elusimicrobia bacterium]|nr:RHS repeat protein [Elusimicrobiota bacterium]